MPRSLRLTTLVLALVATSSFAVDHPIEGDRLGIADPPANAARRKVVFTATRDFAIDPTTVADPRSVGATLEISGENPGDGSSGVIALDPSLWTALGTPPGSKGYRYLDFNSSTGVRKIVFKAGRKGGNLGVGGRGSAWLYQVTQPQGSISARFTVGSDVYCAEFTTFQRNQPGKVSSKKAPPPASCTLTPPVCGNGTIESGEECDDGGTMSGDGCSDTCQLENTSAICAGVPSVAGTSIASVRVAAGLSSPLFVTAPRLDPNRVFVVEQGGRIRIIKNGILLPTAFLAIESKVNFSGEQGLLSMAFHPDYETNGRFFVYYSNTDGDITIARYQVSGNPDLADDTSEKILLTINHQFANNHNGGQLQFGPDGYLYAATGDGGGGGDPLASGQNLMTMLGKQLRIDVDVETPPYYATPAGNPFPGAGDPFDLIWAYGLRNPWRFSFDRQTGELYTADVGQNAWEEVDVQPAGTGGLNYGWRVFEARHCFDPSPAADCPNPPTGFTMPVLEYDHGQGCSIIGGYVYRGCALPDLQGTYFYSDYCSAFVRTFKGVSGGDAQNLADRTADVHPPGGLTIDSVTSLGEDARGELYIVDQGGEVFKIVPGS
ncbi:MAG: PQQ-dependent sugar dehydrogenase [Deltaproteobacteria bacterium]|nr:PQQ-dependent sugar dehydrogenase [Deltaproteobacteria bacterium]